jgi:hypothetical protein
MLGFYSVDIIIDEDDKPVLIEINGSNSGFDGFLIAYEDTSVQDAISAAFRDVIGERNIYVITQLVNYGQLPPGYLDKLIQDVMYFRSVENIHINLRKGVVGANWARLRTDRPPSTIGAGTSLDALVETDKRFQKVFLNVADPSYVIPADSFKSDIERGALNLRDDIAGQVAAHRLRKDDVLWFRSPSLAYCEPIVAGVQVNEEFPFEAIADNKLFTYNLLYDDLAEHLPLSVPLGNRTAGAAELADMLERSRHPLFIRKPLLGSQARGIELFRRQDVQDYADRIAKLDQLDEASGQRLPLDLRGVPDLLAAGVLHYDVNLLSELTLSKPIPCRATGRSHYGCMRTLALVEQNGAALDIRFLGGYWRLAAIPVDGDGMLWERFIGSQSQGAFCEPVSTGDMRIAEDFSRRVLATYHHRIAGMPNTAARYRAWESQYWMERYRQHVPALHDAGLWSVFMADMAAAQREMAEIKQRAEAAGYRTNPATMLTRDQLMRSRLPYLVMQPKRITVR